MRRSVFPQSFKVSKIMKRAKTKKHYQRSAGIVIFHAVTKKILLVKTSLSPRWEWPKGKIESGETVETAARREVREEVGLKKICILPQFQKLMRYHFRVGQQQICKTVYLFAGFGSGRVRLSNEHTAYRWCAYPEAIRLLRYLNQKVILRQVHDQLRAHGYLPGGKIMLK